MKEEYISETLPQQNIWADIPNLPRWRSTVKPFSELNNQNTKPHSKFKTFLTHLSGVVGEQLM